MSGPYGQLNFGSAIFSLQFAHSSPRALRCIYFTVSTALTGLVIYGLTRLTDLVREVHATRGALARMAVTQERLRFARDLHDLLGYSLSAITLRHELIYRLVPERDQRTREELSAVLEISRQALSDVRLVASGYREMSLAAEADSTASVLSAAAIDADIDAGGERLHPLVDTVLATALREGVTTPSRGSGLDLGTRTAAIGGRIEAGVLPDGRFRLLAEVPARPDTTAKPIRRRPDAVNLPRDPPPAQPLLRRNGAS